MFGMGSDTGKRIESLEARLSDMTALAHSLQERINLQHQRLLQLENSLQELHLPKTFSARLGRLLYGGGQQR